MIRRISPACVGALVLIVRLAAASLGVSLSRAPAGPVESSSFAFGFVH
jgi:hypothetical protein